jgi:hypothetical protein
VLHADLDHVDGPRESRLVGVRWVARGDEHAPRGIEPALDLVVDCAGSARLVPSVIEEAGRTYSPPLTPFERH